MSETPRSKVHALRPAASSTAVLNVARPPSLDAEIRPILQSKKDFRSPRRPTKPILDKSHPADTFTIVLPDIYDAKPGSRGEQDGERWETSNQRPRSNGPEAGDVVSTSPRQPDGGRPLLASDLYFELQKQQEMSLSPRAGRQTGLQRHLYHDKMQQKYNEMRVLRNRIKQLENDLNAAKTNPMASSNTSTTSEQELLLSGPPLVDKASSPAKGDMDNSNQRERLIKLERHLVLAKEEIATLNEQLDIARTNDKAKIDTLEAKLELERVANKVLGERVFDVDASLKACVVKLTEAESTLAHERVEREAMINQLTTLSRQAISDHRRRAVSNKMKGVVSSMGKGTLQTKLDAANQKLAELEAAMKQVQLEALAWKKEALLKQTMLSEYGILKTNGATQNSNATATAPAPAATNSPISKILDLNYTHGVSDRVAPPDILFHGSRLVDGHSLLLHVVRNCDPFALHFVGYDGITAQEDMVSFYSEDITRLVPHGDKYLLQPHDAQLMMELVDILARFLAVGYKNGTFFLVERVVESIVKTESTKVCIYRGNMTLEDHIYVSLCVNEIYRSAFEESWSLEIVAASVADESEWNCVVSMDQVCKVCPHFKTYKPHEAKGWKLDHLVDANELLLQPLLQTLSINSKNELVSSLASESIESAFNGTEEILAPQSKPAERSTSLTLVHRSLLAVKGTIYYLTLRELWDAKTFIEVSLVDSNHDTVHVRNWDESCLLTFMHCVASVDGTQPTQFDFKNGINPSARKTIVSAFRAALDVDENHTISLNYSAFARSLDANLRLVSPPAIDLTGIQVLGPLDDEEAQSAVQHAKYADATRGVRLRDRSLGILRFFKVKTPARPRAYALSLVRVSSKYPTRISWLVVYHRIPIEFVLALWCPPT